MIRIDGYFFYQVGAAIRPLTRIQIDWNNDRVRAILYPAQTWLEGLFAANVLGLKTCTIKGNDLFERVKGLITKIDAMDDAERQQQVEWLEAYYLRTEAQEFETLLAAELKFADLYFVVRKGGFDTTYLAERGESIFPTDLATKVPEAMLDAKAAARCIAFELPTAAGFHLHRANETVLHRYYDAVTDGKPRPESRTIGAYISALRNHKAGDKKVIAALESIKDLHRNPLIHPEDSLESVDEAIALHGAIQSVIVHMLKAIPVPGTVPMPIASAAAQQT